MRDLSITIKVVGADKAKTDLEGVDKAVKGVEASGAKASAGGVAHLEGSMKKLIAAAGGMAAFQKGFENFAGLMQESVMAFTDQEASLARLTTALIAQGAASPAVIAQYEALAQTFQRTTIFSDDLIQEMQALLVQVGQVMPDDMDAALTAATNLAAGLGIDLHAATKLVGKAFAGETGSLKRYGIVIDEARLKAEGLPAVLKAINEKFGGQAQAQAETYGGKIQILSNRWNDFQERIGSVVANAIGPLLTAFEHLDPWFQTMVFGLVAITTVLAPLSVGVAALVIAFGTTLPAAFLTVLPFLGPAGLIAAGVLAVVLAWRNWDAIVGFAKAVYDGVKQWLVDRFQAVVDNIKSKIDAVTGFFKGMYDAVVGNSYVPDMVARIADEFGTLQSVMVGPTQTATTQVSGLFETMAGHVSQTFARAFTGGGGALGAIKTLATEGIATLLNMIPFVGPFISAFAGPIVAGLTKLKGVFRNLFGGPSAKELAGRQIVDDFEDHIATMLTEEQKIEAGNEEWKQTVIFLRDAYVAAGKSEEDALKAAERLWASSKSGAEAAKAAIAEIEAVLNRTKKSADAAGASVAKVGSGAGACGGCGDDPDRYHRGGVVLPFAYRAHRGLAIDEVPIIAQRGEGVLSRAGMRRIGGASGLNRINGGGGGGSATTYAPQVTVYADGDLNSPVARRKLAETVRGVLDQDLRLRRKMSAR